MTIVSLHAERERVVQVLSTLYAQDYLSTAELESRFELVYSARDVNALRAAMAGLPDVHAKPGMPSITPAAGHNAARPSGATPMHEREKRYVAVFSEVRKEGVWAPPAFARVRAYLGTVVLDLREAILPPEGMLIDAETVLGEIRILLPVGVPADVDCTAMLAEVVDKTHGSAMEGPLVRVRGGASLGTIKVQTKLPKKERLDQWRQTVKGWLG